jgi:phospholipase A1
MRALAPPLAGALLSSAAQASSCVSLDDDAARLRCYDREAGRIPAGPVAGGPPAAAPAAPPAPPESAVGRRWELDPGTRQEAFGFRPYRQNYLLPYTHTSAVNTAPYPPTLDALAGAGLIPSTTLPVDATEAKFQLSFKVKAWEDIVRGRADLWLGYTQQSYWQVYNGDLSAPFRETNYEPEAILAVRTDVDLAGLRWRYLNLGLVHQSNGRSEPLSRSWNRIYAEFGLERGPLAIAVRPWYRIKESAGEDDNPDITRFMGHGDLTVSYRAGPHQFGLLARHNFSSGLGGAQVDWSFPLYGPLRGYVQVFSGYGYNLLDYDHRQTVGGIGVLLTDRL